VTVHPVEIPPGLSETALLISVSNPPFENGLEVRTEVTAVSGNMGDPLARETTYACAHDISGPVEICATATYLDPAAQSEDSNISAAYEYLRAPHVRIPDPLDCSEKRCTSVICPEEKNECPFVSSLTVEPMVVPEGGTATIEFVAEDPDDGPETPLVTTLTARHGTITEKASETIYTCDQDVGGVVQICVVASDGDANCDVRECESVLCPGEPLENTCPIIESFSATPMTIPPGMTTTLVRVDAMDPDEFPAPMRIELSSATGVFEDRFASETTTFTCGESGPVALRVKANDGDPTCNETDEVTVQCPSDIPVNVCPMLFVINGIPRMIPEGQTSTAIETRGQDTDGLPFPLTLTLSALWGSFEDTDNIQEPNRVVAQNATYVCHRPGSVEVCVDGTDGACTKTLCDNIICPDDVPIAP